MKPKPLGRPESAGQRLGKAGPRRASVGGAAAWQRGPGMRLRAGMLDWGCRRRQRRWGQERQAAAARKVNKNCDEDKKR